MGSFENKIKSFERHYGIHLRSLRRSRKFTTLFGLFIILLIYLAYKFMTRPKRYVGLDLLENTNDCLKNRLSRYSNDLNLMNSVLTTASLRNELTPSSDGGETIDDRYYVPYVGNGYVGLSLNGKDGIFGYYQKSLSLPLHYNPLASVYLDNWNKHEAFVIEYLSGLVHKIQCFQNDGECITVTNTLFAHRTRPSLIVEEISLHNPTRETVTFDLIQVGPMKLNNSQTKTERYNNHEYTITNGFVFVKSENKEKQLCVSIASTKLPTNIQLKSYDLNFRYNVITVVKYSKSLLNAKPDVFSTILKELDNEAKREFEKTLQIGINKLKQEHINAWTNIWNSGFSISKSLALNALNGDRINASIYYVLSNNRAPLIEITNNNSTVVSEIDIFKTELDRCYEGFSTLHATKLWQVVKNEQDVSDLSALWYLTLMKNGCSNFIRTGIDGILQAIILSIGGFKFSNHHLELNLNPKQIHRNYMFRNINYYNLTLLNVTLEVDDDNHAKIYVMIDSTISTKELYACDAGCIDKPVQLVGKMRHELPVKLTNPPTAILYITDNFDHAIQLKDILHVQEVELAPPQDVNSVALHRHGHHWAGLSILFWSIFVFLIVVFHLFLCKLIFREMFQNSNAADSEAYTNYNYHYIRTTRSV